MGLHHQQITYLSAHFSCDCPDCNELSEEINRDLEITGRNLAAIAAAIGWHWDAATETAYCPAHCADGLPTDGPRPCSPSAPRQLLSSRCDATTAALPRDSDGRGAAMRYLFVGERPSPLAAQRGWQWTDGRVCARTLYRALAAVGISPAEVHCVNLWAAPGLGRPTGAPNLDAVRSRADEGVVVIALGRLVERTLRQAGIRHRFMVHPAARGAIRAREQYTAHVRAVLERRVHIARLLLVYRPRARGS